MPKFETFFKAKINEKFFSESSRTKKFLNNINFLYIFPFETNEDKIEAIDYGQELLQIVRFELRLRVDKNSCLIEIFAFLTPKQRSSP